MPVRKIPKNYLCVTGAFSSKKNEEMDEFESLLEKDYLILLDFDASVKSFEVQPVTVPVPRVPKGYVPDMLVYFHADPKTGQVACPRLVEVKSKKDLEKNKKKYAPKFAAATALAKERGWEFVIVNEDQIRTPRLANLKFLREYRNVDPAQEDVEMVLKHLRKSKGKTSSATLLASLAKTDDDRLYWMPIIWAMLVGKQLSTNLDKPFDDDIPLAVVGSRR